MKKLIVLLAIAGAAAIPLAADAETLPSWTYYAADDTENPFPGEGIGCLSNETWMLCANIRSAASNTLIVSPRNDHVHGRAQRGARRRVRGMVRQCAGREVHGRVDHR